MQNQRRRRELLILTGMLGMCVESIRKYPQYVQFGPYRWLPELNKQFEAACPSAKEQQKEMKAARAVMVLLMPGDFHQVDGRIGLWYVSQTCQQLIGAGWRMPQERVAASFVQELFNIGNQISGEAPPDAWRERVTFVPNIARAHGLYDLRKSL